MTYSVILHIAILIFCSLSFSGIKSSNTLLMDIEIAGEGEFREAMENMPSSPPPQPETPMKQEEEQPKTEEPQSQPEPAPEPEPQAQSETAEDTPKDIEPLEEPQPEAIEETSPATSEEPKQEPEATPQEEPKSEEAHQDADEEPVPQLKKEEPKEEPKPEPKEKPKPKPQKKKRNRKALLDVIKRAEKQDKKKKSRKKLNDIIDKNSKKYTVKKKDAFDDMISGSLAEMGRGSGKGKKGYGAGSFGNGNGLVDSDTAMISAQIYPHWNVSGGVKDAENIVIDVRVQLKDNGEVIPSSVKILDEKRYAEDYIFRAAADSAKHAILEASPLKIPRDKIEMFRDFIFRFNLKEALGG
ncbi:MAG: cell envelope integrity protein TolA [Alphaproteobacteria bacterium]|nr:cell envelope integrity protein TolA [Alphaproteobacteria bacterium]